MRRLTQWLALVFGLYCLVFALRPIRIVLAPLAGADFFHSGLAEAIIQVAFQMLFVLLTYTLALMVNKRLLFQIRTQEEKYSKAFHSSPYAILLTRLSDGMVFEANAGFEQITGYSQREVLGRTTADLHFWRRLEDRAGIVQTLQQEGSVQDKELQFQHKSGTLITALFSAAGSSPSAANNASSPASTTSPIASGPKTSANASSPNANRPFPKPKTLSGLLPICASCKKIPR